MSRILSSEVGKALPKNYFSYPKIIKKIGHGELISGKLTGYQFGVESNTSGQGFPRSQRHGEILEGF